MLIKAEIYKIFSEKRIIAAILCLLLLNAAVCLYSTRSDDTAVPAKTTEEYEEIIQQVIAQANRNIIEYEARGYEPADYLYRKQLKCIDIYTQLPAKVELKPEYIRGWDDYFVYDSVNIFIFAAILIVSTVVFAQENNSGFVSIIRTSAKGRIHTAGAKITAMFLLTCILLLMFTAETLIIFGSTVGFSSLTNAIQALEEFTYSPFALSIGEYLAVTVFFKAAVFTLISAVIMAISCLVSDYAVIYLAGLGVYGVNFLLHTIRYLNNDSLFKNLNLISASEVNPLFSQFLTLNLFGNAAGYISVMCVLFALFSIAAVGLIIFSYCRRRGNPSPKRLINLSFKLKSKSASLKNCTVRYRMGYSSLLLHETYKTLISSRYILLAAALLILKCFISAQEFYPRNSYSDAVYEEYMTVLAGESTEEKQQYLTDERNYINENIAKRSLMQSKYADGEITLDEYGDYLKEYNYSVNREDIFSEVERHASYIARMNERGIDAWFLYDTGWKALFFSEFDPTLYAVILILFTGVFANEYNSKSSDGSFVSILRTTKNGRALTCRYKYFSAVIISVILAIVWNVVDIFAILNSYALPLINAPLLSIEAFETFPYDITVAQYLIIFYAVRMLAAVLLACFILSLSAILHRHIAVMTTAAVVTLFPALLSYFGLAIFAQADFTALMRATPIFMQDGMPVYAVLAVVCGTVAAVCAGKLWERGR